VFSKEDHLDLASFVEPFGASRHAHESVGKHQIEDSTRLSRQRASNRSLAGTIELHAHVIFPSRLRCDILTQARADCAAWLEDLTRVFATQHAQERAREELKDDQSRNWMTRQTNNRLFQGTSQDRRLPWRYGDAVKNDL
jgi:hypothetical protein